MRLVTWNTQWRFGRWQARQPLIVEALQHQDPDVVLLQETWPDQATDLADATGLQVLGFGGGFFDQTLSSVPDDERFGNAVLARQGRLVIDKPFESPGDPAPRHLVAAEIDGIVVASVHLCHLGDGVSIRQDQLKQIVALLRETGPRFVLAGDCNLVPTSEEYRTALALGLHDTWDELNGNQPLCIETGAESLGPTMVPANPEITHVAWMNERNGPTVPAGTGVRLDYVWASEAAMFGAITRFGSTSGSRWPSDHLGLSAKLHQASDLQPEE